MEKERADNLTGEEREELERIHAEANRLMLQKSYACVLLKWRGHDVPKPRGM